MSEEPDDWTTIFCFDDNSLWKEFCTAWDAGWGWEFLLYPQYVWPPPLRTGYSFSSDESSGSDDKLVVSTALGPLIQYEGWLSPEPSEHAGDIIEIDIENNTIEILPQNFEFNFTTIRNGIRMYEISSGWFWDGDDAGYHCFVYGPLNEELFHEYLLTGLKKGEMSSSEQAAAEDAEWASFLKRFKESKLLQRHPFIQERVLSDMTRDYALKSRKRE